MPAFTGLSSRTTPRQALKRLSVLAALALLVIWLVPPQPLPVQKAGKKWHDDLVIGKRPPTPMEIIEHHMKTVPAQKHQLIPLEFYVMSKCPDARDCEALLPAIIDEVGNITALRLTYSAKLDSSAALGVECMHGIEECYGNMQQLCLMKYHPDPKEYLPFIECQNRQQNKIGEDLNFAEDCAKEAEIEDWSSTIVPCAEGDEGQRLLKQSAWRAYANSGMVSCTIKIDKKRVCVRDGGEWKQCKKGHTVEDFAYQIRDKYKERLRNEYFKGELEF